MNNTKALKEWTHAHWPAIKKWATGCFVALVVTLLIFAATRVHWGEVLDAIAAMPARTLWLAAALTFASYLLYSCFDLLGRWYTGHALVWWRCMMVGFISYAFTMNLGAPVGGLGMRLRLYTKQGLAQGVTLRVMGMSLATNWIGYVMLAGIIFALGGVRLPENWKLGSDALRVIGMIMVVAIVAYLVMCGVSRTRSWKVHGHTIELPSLRIALFQVSLAMINWSLIGAVIYVLLQQKVDYLLVLGTLLVSAVAGALAHIPGGLGVLESVFIALLPSTTLGRSEILGALLVYRATYYLMPLFIAASWYLGVEARMSAPDAAENAAGGASERCQNYPNR